MQDFFDAVFGDEVPDGAVALGWKVQQGRNPMFPEPLGTIVGRVTDRHAFYYGTASLYPCAEGVRNKKALFAALHVIVLDDIGTKVPVDSLPDTLRAPTYIIESSEGNFQYGYALETPLTDYDEAALLVQLIYDSGYTDGGGAMPNKLVRMPAGINGKKGERGDWTVQLRHLDDWVFTPQGLLDAVEANVVWDEAIKDVAAAQRARRGASTTAWSPVKIHAPSAAGIVDPVLEWLYERDLVLNETGEWITVQCPNAENHTDGNDWAGYSPMGMGADGWQHSRGFHCYHDHCKDWGARQFLQWVADKGGPEAGVRDLAGELVAEWAYDDMEDGARSLASGKMVRMAAFRNLHPQKTLVPQAAGKPRAVGDVQLWLTAPNRVSVSGWTVDPTTKAPLVTREGQLRYNAFRWPDHALQTATAPAEGAAVFFEFVRYLIPDDAERQYFLDWLAAKAQDFTFRGAGILMVTPAYGTGRTTLAAILTRLIGPWNCSNVKFTTLVNDSDFNEWQSSMLVFCDETRDLAGQSAFSAYERLKDVVDPRSKTVTINAKYARKMDVPCYTSMMMFSNHTDALAMDRTDRRLFVIRNPRVPAEPAFFTRLNEWLDAGGWEASLWQALRAREIDIESLLAPVPMTKGKETMVEEAQSPVSVAVTAFLRAWKSDWVSPAIACELIEQFSEAMPPIRGSLRKIVRRELDRHLEEADGPGERLRWEGKQYRFRRLIGGTQAPGDAEFPSRADITAGIITAMNDF